MKSRSGIVRKKVPKHCWQTGNKRFVTTSSSKRIFLKDKESETLNDLTNVIPGLQHALDTRKGFIFNFVWFLVVGCSATICFYQIFNRIDYFLSKPINSRVTVQRNMTVKFPSVTICSYNDRYVELIPYKQLWAKKNNFTNICTVNALHLLSELNIADIWKMMNVNGTVFKAGTFSRTQLLGGYKINPADVKTVLTIYGNCTTYSIKKLVPFRSLDYLLMIHFNFTHVCPVDQFTLYVIHNDDDDITYKISTEFLRTPENSPISYGLSAKRFKILNRPEAPCHSASYVNQCEKKCVEDIIKTEIDCRFPYMSFEEKPLCNTSTEAIISNLKTYAIASSFSYSQNCSCPLICDETVITKNLKKSVSGKDVLGVYFEDNVIDNIEEYYSYQFIPFICDVGGNLGLFLGLCIPAIIDVFQSLAVKLIKHVFEFK